MRRVILATLVTAILLLIGCVPKPVVQTTVTPKTENVVGITIRDNGISTDSSGVVVKNFYAGARAEMVYRIHNATAKAVRPEIYIATDADVTNYSKAEGAIRATPQVLSWIELPITKDVAPGAIEDFVVAIAMPKGEKRPAEKVGFQIGVAGATGEKLQMAVGTWWLVSMR